MPVPIRYATGDMTRLLAGRLELYVAPGRLSDGGIAEVWMCEGCSNAYLRALALEDERRSDRVLETLRYFGVAIRAPDMHSILSGVDHPWDWIPTSHPASEVIRQERARRAPRDNLNLGSALRALSLLTTVRQADASGVNGASEPVQGLVLGALGSVLVSVWFLCVKVGEAAAAAAITVYQTAGAFAGDGLVYLGIFCRAVGQRFLDFYGSVLAMTQLGLAVLIVGALSYVGWVGFLSLRRHGKNERTTDQRRRISGRSRERDLQGIRTRGSWQQQLRERGVTENVCGESATKGPWGIGE